MSAATSVPPPTGDSTWKRPSRAAIRSSEPHESAAVGPGAADAVVANLNPQPALLDTRAHLDALRARVFRDVGERLRDDKVGGGLDSGGKAANGHAGVDRHRRSRGKCLHSCAQPAAGENRRQDAVRELPQLDVRPLGLGEGLGQERRGVIALLERPVRQLQRDNRVDEALLRPVVQIPNHPSPLLIGRRHDPRTRRRQASSSCLAVVANAAEISSVNSTSRSSMSPGRGSSSVESTDIAPQRSPLTTIGAPAAALMPVSRAAVPMVPGTSDHRRSARAGRS